MSNKTLIIGSFISLELLLGMNSSQVIAQMTHQERQSSNIELENKFQKVEQPLWLKGVVTAGGLGLIGLELWWFILSKSSSQK